MNNTAPTIHMNGTSRQVLLDQQTEILKHLRAAAKAMEEASPNARDYYLQGPNAILCATAEHSKRAMKVQELLKEISELAMAIADSGK